MGRAAAFRTVVTRRTNVVEGSIQAFHTSLAHVADLQAGLATLVRSGHRAATAAEVTLAALARGRSKPLRGAVITRSAGRALRLVPEAERVAIRAVRAQELRRKAGARRTVAALGTNGRRSGIALAVGSSGTSLSQ
jgi:hypothetical protein